MTDEQLARRTTFVTTLEGAGWRPLPFNADFDQGLNGAPEASLEYAAHGGTTLRLDFQAEDPRVILYVDAADGRSLGLVFRCFNRLEVLLDAIVTMQDTIGPGNIPEHSKKLLAACPEMFKISASGDKEIPVRSTKR
jgi:hypothetical protein